MAEKTKDQLRKDIAVYKEEIKNLKAQVEEGKKINKDNAVAYALTMHRQKGIISVIRIIMLIEFVVIFALTAYVITA